MMRRFVSITDNFLPALFSLLALFYLFFCHALISNAAGDETTPTVSTKHLLTLSDVTVKSNIFYFEVNNPADKPVSVKKLKLLFKPVRESQDCGPMGPSRIYMFDFTFNGVMKTLDYQSMIDNGNAMYFPVSKPFDAQKSERFQIEFNLIKWMLNDPVCLKRFVVEGTLELVYDDHAVSDAKPFKLLADAWPGPIKYPNK